MYFLLLRVRQNRLAFFSWFEVVQVQLVLLTFSPGSLLYELIRYAILFSLFSPVSHIVAFDIFSTAIICCCFTA